MVRKPKGSHLAYKEWAPSVKLSQQNIIRISYGTYNVLQFLKEAFKPVWM